MNTTLQKVLVISTKNAVNAILTNVALMGMLHDFLNITTRVGWYNIGKVTLSVVVAREAMVWVPALLKWSTSNGSQE
jgi:hypothetical protein